MSAEMSRAAAFERDGFLVVPTLLEPDELGYYREIYDRLLSGEIDAGARRYAAAEVARRGRAAA